MEESEILSRILFGKPGDSVSPWQLAYLAYALDVIDGGGPILQKLDRGQDVLGFDQISLKQSEDESGLSAIQVGKQLSERVYLEGEVGFKDQPDVFAIEAELAPSLILRTETSPRMREGIGIYWRRDY